MRSLGQSLLRSQIRVILVQISALLTSRLGLLVFLTSVAPCAGKKSCKKAKRALNNSKSADLGGLGISLLSSSNQLNNRSNSLSEIAQNCSELTGMYANLYRSKEIGGNGALLAIIWKKRFKLVLLTSRSCDM